MFEKQSSRVEHENIATNTVYQQYWGTNNYKHTYTWLLIKGLISLGAVISRNSQRKTIHCYTFLMFQPILPLHQCKSHIQLLLFITAFQREEKYGFSRLYRAKISVIISSEQLINLPFKLLKNDKYEQEKLAEFWGICAAKFQPV